MQLQLKMMQLRQMDPPWSFPEGPIRIWLWKMRRISSRSHISFQLHLAVILSFSLWWRIICLQHTLCRTCLQALQALLIVSVIVATRSVLSMTRDDSHSPLEALTGLAAMWSFHSQDFQHNELTKPPQWQHLLHNQKPLLEKQCHTVCTHVVCSVVISREQWKPVSMHKYVE